MRIDSKQTCGYGIRYAVVAGKTTRHVLVLFGRTTCSGNRCGASCAHARFVLKNNAGDFVTFERRKGN